MDDRELTKNMRAELERNGVVASFEDYEARTKNLIDLNDGHHDLLDFIPDFIMIDLLKEYKFSLGYYQNIDEFADGILNYQHGNVQVMRKIAKHFFVFNPQTKEYELDEDFRMFSSTQLERMARWSKQELLDAKIDPYMKVNEIDAKVRENGLKNTMRVTDEEQKLLGLYRIADDTTKNKIRKILDFK